MRHVGLEASSASASHTLAPELRALIVIFGSVGPVISTRRSSRPGAPAEPATRHDGSSRTGRVDGRKSGSMPSATSCRRCWRSMRSSWRRATNRSCSSVRKSSASGVRISR
ncbi:Uncharacterised protein [Mycobacteroides abscessus]|nr:Uncharacterised protein [Mycobacteroides abscessus]